MLYVDTDTFFVADPAPLLCQLARGTALMHQPEYTFEQAVAQYAAFGQVHYPQRFLQLLATRTFEIDGQQWQFQGSQRGWNSGVLGLPPAVARLLPAVYALTDAFYAGSGWFTSEQLAFSLALPTRFPLERSDSHLFHYWGQGQKKLLDHKLTDLLAPPFSQLSLPARLARVLPLTSRWRRQAEVDRLQEGALYALGRGRLLPGAKYAVKALLKAPSTGSFSSS